MAKKADWKKKREESLEIKIPWVIEKLGDLGYRGEPDGYAVKFRVGTKTVRFYPFTGGIAWESKPTDKRGWKNLVKMIKNYEKGSNILDSSTD